MSTGHADSPRWCDPHAEGALNSHPDPRRTPLPPILARFSALAKPQRRQDLRRKQSAVATRFGHREPFADLLLALAKSPNLFFLLFVFSVLCLTSPNLCRSRHPPSSVASAPEPLPDTGFALGKSASSSSTPRCNQFAFYRPKSQDRTTPAMSSNGAAVGTLNSDRRTLFPHPNLILVVRLKSDGLN